MAVANTNKTKFIFVTGGVASSLGKGIISASLAKLLQARGYKVAIQKLAPSLLVDYALIDAARGHVVGLRGRNVRKPLVMSQIEVGLGAVLGYVAFAVLVRIQRAGIDIDVRVEFLDRYPVSARLQQARQGC